MKKFPIIMICSVLILNLGCVNAQSFETKVKNNNLQLFTEPGPLGPSIDYNFYHGEPILKLGDTNSHVTTIKGILGMLGFFGSTMDNTFDKQLEDGIKKFQNWVNIRPSGIVDMETWSMLNKCSRH